MTKKQLLDLISDYPDNAEVVIEVHDTTLYEDLYDFNVDAIDTLVPRGQHPMIPANYELRLCPIKNTKS